MWSAGAAGEASGARRRPPRTEAGPPARHDASWPRLPQCAVRRIAWCENTVPARRSVGRALGRDRERAARHTSCDPPRPVWPLAFRGPSEGTERAAAKRTATVWKKWPNLQPPSESRAPGSHSSRVQGVQPTFGPGTSMPRCAARDRYQGSRRARQGQQWPEGHLENAEWCAQDI